MIQTIIKKERAGIFKSFLEDVVAKYPTWNSFIEGLKKEFKIGMFLDEALSEDVVFDNQIFDYHYFHTNDESSTRKVGEGLTDFLLTKNQAFTVLANEIYLFRKKTYATQIKFDDYKVGFLGSQDQAPPSVIYFEEPVSKTTGLIAVKLYGNINHGVGAQHYRFDKLCNSQDILQGSNHHLVKGSTIFCK